MRLLQSVMSTTDRHFNKAIEYAQVGKIKFISLRNTFGSNLAKNGGSVYALKEYLRYSSNAVTEKLYLLSNMKIN